MRTYLHQEAREVHRVVHRAGPHVDEVDESLVKQELHRNVRFDPTLLRQRQQLMSVLWKERESRMGTRTMAR
jgi:hypothetical protein